MRARTSKSWILGAFSSLFLAALSFYLGFMPSNSHSAWISTLFAILDTPISAVNAALPAQLQSGLARRFLSGTYCFPGPLWYEFLRYVAVGFVSYLLLFGVALACANGIMLARRVGARPPTPT
jgi:hypothetical protein